MEGKLYTETVEPETLALLRKFMADERLNAFNLVGGTALSLQLGHRKSIDLDLFTTEEFNPVKMAEHLKSQYATEIGRQNSTGVFGLIEKTKFDILKDPFPVIDPVRKIDGVRMLSLLDIGAMKISAIYDNGGRLKDFIDMYKLLEKHSLNAYLDYALQKDDKIHPAILKQSLLYHKDIDLRSKIDYIEKPVKWPWVVERFREAFLDPGKIFSRVDTLKNENLTQKTPRLRRGPRPS